MTGTQAETTDAFTCNSNSGYFTYTNTSSGTPSYHTFIPTEISSSNQNLVIKHINSTNPSNNIYVIFSLSNDSTANPLIKDKSINLNSLILDQLDRKSGFNLISDISYATTETLNTFTNGNHYFNIPGTINAKYTNFNATEATTIVSNYTTATASSNKTLNIKMTPASFAHEEIICNDATIDQQNITQTNIVKFENYSAYGITFGVIILAVSILWLILQAFLGRFDAVAGILGWNTGEQKIFTVIFSVLIIISSAMFITYGVQIGQKTSDKRTAALPYSLSSAITFLVLAATMIIYKIKYPSA